MHTASLWGKLSFIVFFELLLILLGLEIIIIPQEGIGLEIVGIQHQYLFIGFKASSPFPASSPFRHKRQVQVRLRDDAEELLIEEVGFIVIPHFLVVHSQHIRKTGSHLTALVHMVQ